MRTGRDHLAKILTSPVIRQMVKNTYEGEIDPAEVDATFDARAAHFPR